MKFDFDGQLPLIDAEIKGEISLANIVGLPDFSDGLKKFDDAFNNFRQHWAVLLTNAGNTGECDLARFLATYGGVAFDKICFKIGKLFG